MRKFAALRRSAFIILIFSILICSFSTVSAASSWSPEGKVSLSPNESIYLINEDTGTVVYQKAAQKQIAPYSITKLMTAILTMEKFQNSLNTVITVQQSDLEPLYGTDSSIMDLKVGDKLTVEQLLEGLLIYSGNDAANVLARATGGSISDFITMMNQKAKEIGCKDTHYVNPHGLPDLDQFTTAQDTYLIAKYAMEHFNGKLASIVSTTYFQFKDMTLPTTNAMLRSGSQYYYKYVKGIKTGSGDDFVNCVSYAEKGGMTYYAVVLGGSGDIHSTNTCFADSVALYKWAFSSFKIMTLVNSGTPQAEIGLDLAWNRSTLQLDTDRDFSALVPSDTDIATVKVKPHEKFPTVIMAPVTKGQKVGIADVMLGNQKIGEVNLVSDLSVERSAPLYFVYIVGKFFKSIWFKIISVFLILLLIGYLVLSYLYNRRKRIRNKRRKKYKMPK